MRVVVAKMPISRMLRWTERTLLACAVVLLGYAGFIMTDSWMFLGYVSGNTLAGGHRTVRVVAKAAGKDLVVRTRVGYIAGGDAK